MASIPQLYSNYSSPYHFSRFQNPLLFPQENCTDGIAMAIPSAATYSEEISNFPMFLDNFGVDVFQQEQILTSSFPTAYDNVRYRLQDVCDEFGQDYFNGFVHQDFKPVDPTRGENWGNQGSNLMLPGTEDNNHRVVRYSEEERKDRILRYLKKRNQRNFNKTIKYACRKSLADRRIRVRGRFARNTEQCEEEMVTRKEDDYSPIHKNLNYCDAVQIKQDEDEWLEEAMANLIYLPYIAG